MLSSPGEIEAVTRAMIHAKLADPAADRFRIAEMPSERWSMPLRIRARARASRSERSQRRNSAVSTTVIDGAPMAREIAGGQRSPKMGYASPESDGPEPEFAPAFLTRDDD